MNAKYNFKGWIEWYKDETENQKKMMSGLGKIEGLFTGKFLQNTKFGYGIYYSTQGLEIWGEWNKDSIHSGIIVNKIEKYIFIGNFADFKLTSGNGSMLFLKDNDNDHGILAY